LHDDGYRTGLFHSGRFGYLGMRGIVEDRGFDTLADAGTVTGRHDSSFGIDEASTVEAMLEWIDARESDEPFFLVYLPIVGHHPYATTSPGPFPPSDERNRYLNAIHEADRALGQLRTGLEARGLDGETLYVVFGDHGEAFGQHEGNIGHSFYLYEENVRVPYLIAAPGPFDEAPRAGQTVSVVDTAPTVLELLGRAVPEAYEGASALDGRARMAFFVTDYAQQRLGLIDGCSKVLYDLDSEAAELYDVCADPEERSNLAQSEPERVAAYTARLTSWDAATREAIRAQQP
jgi:arylsulfatase A-like enzyme